LWAIFLYEVMLKGNAVMLSKEDNELLCRVGEDAPMGQLMRRHWVPALLSEEVSEPDGKPIRVRVLGQDLVVFRDTQGNLGVLDELCPHRKASLVYGRNEESGLRCLYHGWKFDVNGKCLEMASEPPESSLCEKVTHKSWPHREWAGFVWVYLGAEDKVPEFQAPPFAPEPDTQVSILKIKVPCNWAQITEGQIDSAHSSSLHSSDMVPAPVESAKANETNWLRPSTDNSPRLQLERTEYGFRYAAIRRPIKNAATHEYVRITAYVAPFISLIPPNTSYNVASVIVPIDDENTAFHFIAWGGTDCPDTQTWRKFAHAEKGIDVDDDFNCLRTLENDFLQDREAMKQGNFTGIKGIPNQDIAMWTSMGRLVDRSKDTLGSSDLAIVEFRRIMADAAKRMRDEGVALGEGSTIRHTNIAAYQKIIAKAEDWREMADSEG
jgi:phthalate 4,5-dioxygenase oxygenase subunit